MLPLSMSSSMMWLQLQKEEIISFFIIAYHACYMSIYVGPTILLAPRPWPLTFTFELDLDILRPDLHAKFKVWTLVPSVRRARRTHTQTDRHTDAQTHRCTDDVKTITPSADAGCKKWSLPFDTWRVGVLYTQFDMLHNIGKVSTPQCKLCKFWGQQ